MFRNLKNFKEDLGDIDADSEPLAETVRRSHSACHLDPHQRRCPTPSAQEALPTLAAFRGYAAIASGDTQEEGRRICVCPRRHAPTPRALSALSTTLRALKTAGTYAYVRATPTQSGFQATSGSYPASSAGVSSPNGNLYANGGGAGGRERGIRGRTRGAGGGTHRGGKGGKDGKTKKTRYWGQDGMGSRRDGGIRDVGRDIWTGRIYLHAVPRAGLVGPWRLALFARALQGSGAHPWSPEARPQWIALFFRCSSLHEEGEDVQSSSVWGGLVITGVRCAGARISIATRTTATSTRRFLTLTYAAGVRVWDASAWGRRRGGARQDARPEIGRALPGRCAVGVGEERMGRMVDLRDGGFGGCAPCRGRPGRCGRRAMLLSLVRSLESTYAVLERRVVEEEVQRATVIIGVAIHCRALGTVLIVQTPHALYIYSLAAGRVVGVWRAPASSASRVKSTAGRKAGGGGTDDGTKRMLARRARLRRSSGWWSCDVIPRLCPSVTPGAAARIFHFRLSSANSGQRRCGRRHDPLPPALVVLARPSLRVLYVFPAAALAVPHPPPAPPPPPPQQMNGCTSPLYASISPPTSSLSSASPPAPAPPTPTSELDGRLLAFLVPAPGGAAPGVTPATPLETRAARSDGPEGGGGAGAWVRVANLGSFVRHGTRLFVVRKDGLGAGVWGVRPSPLSSSASSSTAADTLAPSGTSADTLSAPTQLYELRRGRTGAVVEGVAGARDGRFVALATRRRTVHVFFAVNPYGGRADGRSHVRVRMHDGEGAEEAEAAPLAPLAIAFVPPAHTPGRPQAPCNNNAPTGARGVQDVFVFDPADGVLSLRRVTLALEAAHEPAGLPLPISVSLPAAGRRVLGTSMSPSPPAYAASYARGHSRAAAGAQDLELGGREALIATWSLRRRRGWAEIHRAQMKERVGEGIPVKEDWLAQADSPARPASSRAASTSQQIHLPHPRRGLPRAYPALPVRQDARPPRSRGQRVRNGRRGVVEGFTSSSSPCAILRRSRASSSFEEPLASALAGTYTRSRRLCCRYCPTARPRRSAVRCPCMRLWVGRRRRGGSAAAAARERHQRQKRLAHSPPVRAHARAGGGGGDDVEASVPLEFNEEDEDFILPPSAEVDEVFLRVHADCEDDDALSATTSRNGDDSVASISTSATSAHPLEDEERIDNVWHGWGSEDKLAVEEAERFDDISVVGFLDEAQAAMKAQAEAECRKGVATAAPSRKRRS
ncbi:hypothetical protein DFH09DRAFT_1280184 [Mycena vulgaris]|nr:hypothetical protein DFH09DRAFT_1280184 [Mycena vulgaris]